jgi:hypothetical protein
LPRQQHLYTRVMGLSIIQLTVLSILLAVELGLLLSTCVRFICGQLFPLFYSPLRNVHTKRMVRDPLAGVLAELYSQLIPLSGTAVQARQSI